MSVQTIKRLCALVALILAVLSYAGVPSLLGVAVLFIAVALVV
jgi:hypothetical protein